MRSDPKRLRRRTLRLCCTLALGLVLVVPALPGAQERGNPAGEWRYQSGDAWGTRYSSLDQNRRQQLRGPRGSVDLAGGQLQPATPVPIALDAELHRRVLYTVAGYRRTVAAIDPATGETLWTYREPNTKRWEESMRASYGKGVAYTEVEGRGVIYVITPAFFLHALDAKTGEHLEGFGTRVPLPGLPAHGCHRPPRGPRV